MDDTSVDGGQVHRALGLSGGAALGWAARAEGDGPVASCSRRHQTAADLAAAPWAVWPTQDVPPDATGLGTHLADVARAGERLPFTDVLLVLSAADADRILDLPAWARDAARTLELAAEELFQRLGAVRAHPRRDLGLRVRVDGEDAGPRLGLERGSFVTVLVPQTYAGPLPSSAPLATVRVRFPGDTSWTTATTLCDDGIRVTLGSHWTDSWSHPGLRMPGLYRLDNAPGGWRHGVGAGLEDRFSLHAFEVEGSPVYALATRSGGVVAWISVLTGEGAVEIPIDPAPRVLVLERGAMIQKVPFKSVIDGYDVHVSGDGRIGTAVPQPAALIRVREKSQISLFACEIGVFVDDREMRMGEERPLTRDARLRVGEVELFWRDVRDAGGARWPYLAEVRRVGAVFALPGTARITIGRGASSTIVLPDDRRNQNIQWSDEAGSGATVHAGGREIARADVYIDSVNVASAHAEIELGGPWPIAECVARNSFVYVRKAGEISSLWPVGHTWPHTSPLGPGDEVIVGNCLFEVRVMPADVGTRPPPPEFRHEGRAAAVLPLGNQGSVVPGVRSGAAAGASSAPAVPRVGAPRPPPPPPVVLTAPPAPSWTDPEPTPPAPEPTRPEPPRSEPPRVADPRDDLLDAPVPNFARLHADDLPEGLRAAVREALSSARLTAPGPWIEGGAGRDAIVALLHGLRPDRIGALYLFVEPSGLRAGGHGAEAFVAWWDASGIRDAVDAVWRADTLRPDLVDDVARIVKRRLDTW